MSGELALVVELMAAAEGRCSYADARFVRRVDESLGVRNGAVERADLDSSEGIGVRVRVGGAWGFASTREVSTAGAEAALQRALAIAAAQPDAPDRPMLDEPPAPLAEAEVFCWALISIYWTFIKIIILKTANPQKERKIIRLHPKEI